MYVPRNQVKFYSILLVFILVRLKVSTILVKVEELFTQTPVLPFVSVNNLEEYVSGFILL